jgi:DNA-binding NarL/FixJ family response regulator
MTDTDTAVTADELRDNHEARQTEVAERAVTLLRDGKSQCEVADALDLHPATVSGIACRNAVYAHDQSEAAKELDPTL